MSDVNGKFYVLDAPEVQGGRLQQVRKRAFDLLENLAKQHQKRSPPFVQVKWKTTDAA